MRRPKQPRTAPEGWQWLYALAQRIGVDASTFNYRARRDAIKGHYRRHGDGKAAPWLVSDEEASKLVALYGEHLNDRTPDRSPYQLTYRAWPVDGGGWRTDSRLVVLGEEYYLAPAEKDDPNLIRGAVGWLVWKATKAGHEARPQVYVVSRKGAEIRCTCGAGRNRGDCKHLKALTALSMLPK